jgi:hypothetical protein
MNMGIFEYIYSDGSGLSSKNADTIAQNLLATLYFSASRKGKSIVFKPRIDALVQNIKNGKDVYKNAKGTEAYFYAIVAHSKAGVKRSFKGEFCTQGGVPDCTFIAAINTPYGTKLINDGNRVKAESGGVGVILRDRKYLITNQELSALSGYFATGKKEKVALEIALAFDSIERRGEFTNPDFLDAFRKLGVVGDHSYWVLSDAERFINDSGGIGHRLKDTDLTRKGEQLPPDQHGKDNKYYRIAGPEYMELHKGKEKGTDLEAFLTNRENIEGAVICLGTGSNAYPIFPNDHALSVVEITGKMLKLRDPHEPEKLRELPMDKVHKVFSTMQIYYPPKH